MTQPSNPSLQGPATNIEEAVAILRELRERVINQYDMFSARLLADIIDTAVALLEGRPEA